MRDFTLTTYKLLLTKLKAKSYQFFMFRDYRNNSKLEIKNEKILILRHDVDRLPENALATARIENEMGIRGSYYFRIVPQSFDEKIIRQIAELGHEIGYHYEDVDLVWRNRRWEVGSGKSKALSNKPIEQSNIKDKFSNELLIDLAYESFCKNLDKLRQIAEIKTICMHGSPLSKYDNKMLWTKYDYRKLDILGEPYLDINWSEFGYLTDTGRRWDGVAIRDKVRCDMSSIGSPQSAISSRQSAKDESIDNEASAEGILKSATKKYQATSSHPNRDDCFQNMESGSRNTESAVSKKFKSTFDIIKNVDNLPNKLMITVHPERWTDDWFLWSKQLIWQNAKNLLKTVYLFKS